MTAERVKAWFQEIVQGEVRRYELPKIGALNFVLFDALVGESHAHWRWIDMGRV